jgi:hypothetical protein
VRRPGEKLLLGAFWALYGLIAAAGLGLLAEALFRVPPTRPLTLNLPSAQASAGLESLPGGGGSLASRRFTRRISAPQVAQTPAQAQDFSLDRLIKLTGILDFGGKKPTLAVIEAGGESKAYKAGDKVGETGVLVRDIKNDVIVEFERRRFKVTFAGCRELPANEVGKD